MFLILVKFSLVYEFMSQWTLILHLFKWKERKSPPLSWELGISIALNVGRGIEYLHSLAQQGFIHRDLKPDNILLCDDMRLKVVDLCPVKNALLYRDKIGRDSGAELQLSHLWHVPHTVVADEVQFICSNLSFLWSATLILWIVHINDQI